MPSNTRDSARIERRLVAALTEACEIAKAEITGFDWLTHEVDYAAFAKSLQVVWVFDTRANRELAVSQDNGARMRELTASALEEAGVERPASERYVCFDSEEECHLQHGGDWRLRLAKVYGVKRK
ncbi:MULTISPECIES: hypothetical protein [unclassified Pseudomonas]|uniref:hypothetical protein n=1 Tax=unclassified Pseudomonas TaxID=196821 RepID=UPI0015A32117|nr:MULTISPECIES: hypothetical protein [unclassified Pseudomonas]NWC96304.1 hypothetical protein [Pseudomonas sp. IPO3779]NWD21259.1 hypothetical protein [Pseudomonas sp. IPO3778]